jgi:hypothetical protein
MIFLYLNETLVILQCYTINGLTFPIQPIIFIIKYSPFNYNYSYLRINGRKTYKSNNNATFGTIRLKKGFSK